MRVWPSACCSDQRKKKIKNSKRYIFKYFAIQKFLIFHSFYSRKKIIKTFNIFQKTFFNKKKLYSRKSYIEILYLNFGRCIWSSCTPRNAQGKSFFFNLIFFLFYSLFVFFIQYKVANLVFNSYIYCLFAFYTRIVVYGSCVVHANMYTWYQFTKMVHISINVSNALNISKLNKYLYSIWSCRWLNVIRDKLTTFI